MKTQRRRRQLSFIVTVMLIAALCYGCYYLYYTYFANPLVESLNIEAGTTALNFDDFLLEKKKGKGLTGTLVEPFTEDMSRELGEHQIKFLVDRHEYETVVNVVDTTAPKIKGVKKLKEKIGQPIVYKAHITLTDNADGEIALDVDTSKVNLEEEGIYDITYIATDASGNVKKKKTKLELYRYTDAEKVYNATMARAQRVLKRITRTSDSKAVKMRKAFLWCSRLKYTSPRRFPSDFFDLTWPATYADDCFIRRRGDCHSYSSAFAYLCLAIGYEDVTLHQDKRHPGNGATTWVVLDGKCYDPLYVRKNGWVKAWAVSPKKFKYRSARERPVLISE